MLGQAYFSGATRIADSTTSMLLLRLPPDPSDALPDASLLLFRLLLPLSFVMLFLRLVRCDRCDGELSLPFACSVCWSFIRFARVVIFASVI